MLDIGIERAKGQVEEGSFFFRFLLGILPVNALDGGERSLKVVRQGPFFFFFPLVLTFPPFRWRVAKLKEDGDQFFFFSFFSSFFSPLLCHGRDGVIAIHE